MQPPAIRSVAFEAIEKSAMTIVQQSLPEIQAVTTEDQVLASLGNLEQPVVQVGRRVRHWPRPEPFAPSEPNGCEVAQQSGDERGEVSHVVGIYPTALQSRSKTMNRMILAAMPVVARLGAALRGSRAVWDACEPEWLLTRLAALPTSASPERRPG